MADEPVSTLAIRCIHFREAVSITSDQNAERGERQGFPRTALPLRAGRHPKLGERDGAPSPNTLPLMGTWKLHWVRWVLYSQGWEREGKKEYTKKLRLQYWRFISACFHFSLLVWKIYGTWVHALVHGIKSLLPSALQRLETCLQASLLAVSNL